MKLLLVDGTNVLLRFAHAMVPGNVVADYDLPAVVEMVPKILSAAERAIRECAVTAAQTPYVVVCLDSTENFRKQLYPEYKANRAGSAAAWTNRLTAHCAEVGLFTARSYGFEADDVIATLVGRAARAGHQSAVLSSDNDLLQLASLYCDVFQFGRKGEDRYARRKMAYAVEKFGVGGVLEIPWYKALVGDTTDNVPGMPGIGPVKARKLLREHKNFDGICASGHFDNAQIEHLKLMLQLVTLREDAPLDPITPAQCRLTTSLTKEP
ncbi:MAG TPA: 5'-3' exonuclease H3TH domain-containing protein [Candidatus Saccharimonadales bacterium]|jgi:DNA polymerase-1|nr:5'-3' exonuclease H3TH domain-containing protein [Candidatus Saccharimonadales bacterium]